MSVPMVDATPWWSFLRRAARLCLLRALLRTGPAIRIIHLDSPKQVYEAS